MRKTAFALLMFALCISLSGCSVYDPSETLYCTAMGIDSAGGGVCVSVTVRDKVYSDSADNITMALSSIGNKLGGKLFYKTVRVYVLSSELDEDTVNAFYDFALRERETMVKSRIVSAGECTAAEVLVAFTEKGELEDSLISDSFRDNSLLEVLSRVSGQREPVLLRCVSVSDIGGVREAAGNGITVYNSAGDFAGYARAKAETGVLAARGYAEGIAISAGGYGAIIDSSEYAMEYSGGTVTITLRGSFTVTEQASNAVSNAAEAVSGYMRDCVLEAVRISDSLGDICGIEDYMYRHHGGTAAERVEVTAEFKMNGSGLKK